MDRLWSPWRYSYISQAAASDTCMFCEKAAASDDRANLIIHRAQHNFVLLNLFPYTAGHLMIAPYAHVATLAEAPVEALEEMMLLARDAERALKSAYRPQGFNLGMNLGECAGAGIAGHIHLHVVPRWIGDANFMTTVGETRVIPEDIGTTWEKLVAAWNEGRKMGR